MKTRAYTFFVVTCLAASPLQAQTSVQMARTQQDNNQSPMMMPPPEVPRAAPADLPTTSTVMRTSSMNVLDDKKRLGPNDYVSFRVVEDRDDQSQQLRVNDNGELEVPYAGLIPAAGRTCKQLAYAVKAALEKEYYYNATVIIAVDRISEKSRGKVYVIGSVRGPGPQEIPADETYTVSKAVIRAGGFGDFANKRKVKLTRKNGEALVVDLKRVIEEGRSDEDVVLQPDDQVYVPQRLINM
ncbi:MAG: polysaccharide export protein [Sphingomonas sp.]|nr:polysaccharide export protein [Sphingomonas sp.]MDQ3625561.1 polysaccharide export protein [Verrucomicrobiota bacterium]